MMKTLLHLLAMLMANFAVAAEGGAGSRGVNLPPPPSAGTMSLEEALARRRSVREFSHGALTLDEISRLTWSIQGVTAPELRTAPSPGATYPLEVYLVVGEAKSLAAGVYRYCPGLHRLELVADGDIRLPVADAAAGQTWISKAAMVVVIAAVFERTTACYGKRGERYVYVEAGHVAQNLLLQTTALGLGARPVGAFNDLGISRLLRMPEGEVPLYIVPVGRIQHI